MPWNYLLGIGNTLFFRLFNRFFSYSNRGIPDFYHVNDTPIPLKNFIGY